MFFDEVRIPLANVVGGLDQGWSVVLTTFEFERGGAAFSSFCQMAMHLEQLIGQPVLSFAYPYGAHDEETVRAVREAGFKLAVTTEERPLRRAENAFLLPRYDANTRDLARFNAVLNEGADTESQQQS